MSLFRVHKVYYEPGAESVAIAVVPIDGPLAGKSIIDLYTTQTDLSVLTMLTRGLAEPDENWGDAEVELEAAAQLANIGGELVTPVLDADGESDVTDVNLLPAGV